MDLNRASILGRITQDPEVRNTTTGQTVTNLSVATNRVWTDKNGSKQERAEFHNIVLWGKLAEIAAQYLNKGRRVYLEGRIETRDWTGNDGVKRYRTEIIGENLIMLDGPRGSGATAGPRPAAAQPAMPAAAPELPTIQTAPAAAAPAAGGKDDEIKVEDIPF